MTHILLSRGILAEPYIHAHLKSYIQPSDKVAVVAFSFFKEHVQTQQDYDALYLKDGTYYQKMVDAFKPYGIQEKQISFLHYYNDDQQTLVKKINDASIIYFPGGAPDLLMERIHEKQLFSVIQNQQDKVIVGSSAGAMVQFDCFHISPDREYHKFQYLEGLGFLTGFGIEVHYRRRRKQKSSLRKVRRLKKIPLYAIPDEGALIIAHNQIKCIKAYQLYNPKGVIRFKGVCI